MSCPHGVIAALFSGPCPACARDAARLVAGDAAIEAAELRASGFDAAADERELDLLAIQDELDELGLDPDAVLLTLDNIECTRSFAEFVRAGWHVTDPGTPLQWNWHHQLICDVVQGVLEDWIEHRRDPSYAQRARNVLFGLPPGALKSRILAVFMPAWMWLRFPSWSVLCLSINPKAALRDARVAREVIESPWYQRTFSPAWKLKEDQDALGDYGNTMGGTRLSRGITAETVGLRADLLLLDDPNNPKESQSKSSRDDIIERWTSTLWNRVNDLTSSIRMIVQQRVHVDDLTGFALRQATWAPDRPGGWLHVCIPVEFDPERACRTIWGSDPRTVPGESIHPARFTTEILAIERQIRGPYNYEAQLNLRPAPATGNRFQRGWWRFYQLGALDAFPIELRPGDCDRSPAVQLPRRLDGSPAWDFKCISIDASFGSTEDTASNVAVVVVAGIGARARYVVEDRTIGPRTYFQTCDDAIAAIIAHPDASVLIEKKANGAALKEYIEREARDGKIIGRDGEALAPLIEVYEPSGKGSKADRIATIEPDVAGGVVLLPDGAAWVPEYLDEFTVYPKGKNDRLDATAQAIDHHRETSYAEKIARMS